MNILETKYPLYQEELRELYSILKFKHYKLELKGSSQYVNLKYPSDYDFYSHIQKKDTNAFLEFLNNLIYRIKTNLYMYFIELKIEYPNEKIKFFKDDEIKIINKKNIQLVKLDIILFTNNIFKEVSVIYDFGDKKTKNEIIESIVEDISNLKKENKYFKIIKRLFSIAKIQQDFNSLSILMNILNSELGELNLKINNIETIFLLEKYYNDYLTKNRIKINMYMIGTTDLAKAYRRIFNELNESAKEILSKIGYSM